MKSAPHSTVLSLLLLLVSVPVYAATYYVSPTGNDESPGSSSAPWQTLQHAADNVSAGDTVMIRTGTCAGFRAQSGGTSGFPITFRADEGATPLINDVGLDNIKGSIIEIEGYDWWVIDGLEVTGAPTNAGIDIREAEHVTVRNCFCHHNRKWGIFTGFAEHFTAEYNECSYSEEEHGIYHSNSGDNAVIRYNTCHHNTGCGIQINADPSMGGDGISSDCVVTHNVLYENGTGGGAAINLASVRDSLIANNLMYRNHAGGIAAWDDGQGEKWGSKNNKYYSNTVHMPSDGRWAVNLKNGSSDSKVVDNILIHENSGRGGLEIDSSSLTRFLSDYNILERVSVDDTTIDLGQWQSGYGQDSHSFSQTAAQTFVSPGTDYHLPATALAVDGGTLLLEITDDLDGNARPQGAGYDIGAYERTVACPPCSGPRVENVTFPAGCDCTCTNAGSLTIGANVVIEAGATVTFQAPVVTVEQGFHAPLGSKVYVKQP
ncbi:MAG: right-handed parallel beta-helix repeat-containing protein [Deltaproteobacteria bacterium]|nr:right-handed parallel beta-helix repeat-containing protein [Deltaproteobacteria bacterium]